MSTPGKIDRDEVLARLAASRAEISHLLEPPAGAPVDGPPGAAAAGAGIGGAFPRSRIMRALLTGRGLGAVSAVAGGLLLSRPRLAWRLLRLLPAGAMSRMLLGRVMEAMRSRR